MTQIQENKLPEGWIEMTLGEVTKVFSGSTPSTKESLYWDGNIPWITPKDLSNFNGIFISKGERNITELGFKNSSTQLLPKNTVLFSSRAPIGYVAIAENELTTNQGFKNIVCDEKVSHYRFFYYLLKYKSNYIESLSSGSTFSEASGTLMKSISLLLPPLPEQQAIAKILSSFDDKIELLREQNETLEKIGQEIFKEWFGKYKVGDELPEGWRVGKLGKVIKIKQGKYINEENISEFIFENNKFPVYGGNGIRGYLKDFVYKNPQVVLTCRGNGCGLIQYTKENSSITNSCMAFDYENSVLNSYFLYFLTKNTNFESFTSGSAQPQITSTNLTNLEIIIPENTILEKFNEVIRPIFEKIKINNEEIQTLSKTRDELLPKFMKGEILVKD